MNTMQYIKNLCESRGMVSYTSPMSSLGYKYGATLPSDVSRDSTFVRYRGGDFVNVCYNLETDSQGQFHGFLMEVKINEAEEMIDSLMEQYKRLKKEARKNRIKEL